MTPRVFVSYARRDEKHAIEVSQLLRDHGVDAWLDLDRVSPGPDLTTQLSTAISTSAAVVWVSRRDTPLSRWVGLELSWAMRAGTPIHAIAPDLRDDLEMQVRAVRTALVATSPGVHALAPESRG